MPVCPGYREESIRFLKIWMGTGNFEDRSNRVNGGYSDYGGLADFNWNWSGNRWNNQSFCPLEVLCKMTRELSASSFGF